MNKNDGGAAFPNVLVRVDKNGSEYFIANNGMTLRQWYKGIAPADEIDGRTGATVEQVAKFLGIELKDYDSSIHYVQMLAKARGIWADAMIAEDAEFERR